MNMSDPVRKAWQASAGDSPLPDLDTVREGADLFFRRIRRRNRIEYATAALVIPFFGYAALTLPSSTIRVGAALVVLGTLFVIWQLHRRDSAVPPPGEAALPLIAHQRAQLVRQRDALASVGLWYLLPLVPGLSLIVLARAIDGGVEALARMSWFQIFWIGLVVLIFAGIWWLNRAAARMLQAEIDALDALQGENE